MKFGQVFLLFKENFVLWKILGTCKRKPPGTHHPASIIIKVWLVFFQFYSYPRFAAQHHSEANSRLHIISFIKVSDHTSKR